MYSFETDDHRLVEENPQKIILRYINEKSSKRNKYSKVNKCVHIQLSPNRSKIHIISIINDSDNEMTYLPRKNMKNGDASRKRQNQF